MYKLELRDFIISHENWEELLTEAPYNLKISRDEDYIMFKYNQISSDFSIPLVREARGIIFRESDWKCVCHPFDKFGNYGENYCPDIDWCAASVQEKVDGSLIKFWFDNGWHISTNGTIDAFKAELSDVKYQNFGQLVIGAIHTIFPNEHEFFELLDPENTYMFELVSPYNRVVVPYKETKLYFLGVRNIEVDGKEWNSEESIVSHYFAIPKRYNLHSLEGVQNAANVLSWDEEGYVVCDANFNRVKIKSPQYVMAHYARNNGVINTERLVQVVLDGEQEEFLIYASDYTDELKKVEDAMCQIGYDAFNKMKEIFNMHEFETRGVYAREVKKCPGYMQDFLFHCFDSRIFWDYAKSWNASKWAKAIDGLKEN